MTAEASVLFISGGSEVMRAVYNENAFGYWTSAFPVLLEKHGWLDFETAEPAIMAAPENLARYEMLIVGWLPASAWRAEYGASLRAFEGALFLEGPLPPGVLELAGAHPGSRGERLTEGPLRFGPASEAYIERIFGRSFHVGHREPDPFFVVGLDDKDNPLRLLPKRVATRRPGHSRDLFSDLGDGGVPEQAGRAAASLALAYRARFNRTEQIFPDPRQDAVATLFALRCLAKIRGRSLREMLGEVVGGMVEAKRDVGASGEAAIRAIILTEAAAVLGDERLDDEAARLLGDTLVEPAGASALTSEDRAWHACASIALLTSGKARRERVQALQLAPFLPSFPAPSVQRQDVPLVWLLQLISSRAAGPLPTQLVRAGIWLDGVAEALLKGPAVTWPQEFDRFTTQEVMLVISALMRRGRTEAAERAWRECVRLLYEPERSSFWNGKVQGGKLERLNALAVTPWLALALADLSGEIAVPDAADLALANYDSRQVEAWGSAPYWLESVELSDACVCEVSVHTSDADLPAIWQCGNVVATSFQLLSHLMHLHTMHPLDAPHAAHRHVDGMVLEWVLFKLLGRTSAAQGCRPLSVGPWPWGVDYCATIRHDVDRILTEEQFEQLFGLEQREGVAVTWFWLPDRLESAQLKRLEDAPRHEIGLHSIRLGAKATEREQVRSASPPSAEVVGEAYHGAGDSWLGHPSVREAVELGLLYTELVPTVADVPYWRFPTLERDGVIGYEPILGITYNGSIDGKLGDAPESQTSPGIYRQLLNHPDINYDRVALQIDSFPDGNRLDWTCAQVAHWWRATHRREALEVTRVWEEPHIHHYRLSANSALEDVELRLGVAAEDVVAVTSSGAGHESNELEWAPLDVPEMTGIRIRVSLPEAAPVDIRIETAPERAGRLASVADSATTAG